MFLAAKNKKYRWRIFLYFKCQKGKIAAWKHISCEMCYSAGDILGKIHAVEPITVESHIPVSAMQTGICSAGIRAEL